MGDSFKISLNPHVRSQYKSSSIMGMVLIALLPASILGVYHLGSKALIIILISVLTCIATEFIYEKLVHKTVTIRDFSAVVTGLLLALNLSPTVAWWIPLVGGIFAILFIKQLFGGLGQNLINPALGAKCFLLIFFTGSMTGFVYEEGVRSPLLDILKIGDSEEILNILLGNIGETIGTTSLIAIILGAIFLIWFEIIDLYIPGTYIFSFSIFVLLLGGNGLDLKYLITEIFSGGLMLGAFFMASDYVTSPITKKGQLLYGCILGTLTGVFRLFGNQTESVAYAIILGNFLVPLVDKMTRPIAFGK